MKKILISLTVFLTIAMAHSSYMTEQDFDIKSMNCEAPVSLHTSCPSGSKCVKITPDYDCSFSVMVDEYIDNPNSPIWGQRSLIELCSGELDCRQKAEAKACTDGRHSLYNAEYSEVWCNKIIGYNQVPSGRKIVSTDLIKKTDYEEKIGERASRLDKIKVGRMKRKKCEDAYSYIAGYNEASGRTEAEVDKMEIDFAQILDALQKKRSKKARRLVGEIMDPAYSDLKSNLLLLLK